MAFYYKKSVSQTTTWSKQHDAFCLEKGLTPAAKHLWQWLMNEGKQNEQIEPDLAEFKEWVGQYRSKGGFTRPTIKAAFAQLREAGVILLVKQYSWRIVRIITRTLDWINPKKNSRSRSEIVDLPTSNPQSVNDDPNSSSNSSISSSNKEEVLKVCDEAGIHFDSNKPSEVFSYSVEEVRCAIEVFKLRSITSTINNPQGWLIKCLEYRYWEDQVSGLTLNLGGLL